MLALLEKLKENARFDGKEKSAITSQHAIWQRSVRQVCKQNVPCAARAVAGRKSLYEWADRNHTSSLQPIPPADEIASTIRKAIVGIESPARKSSMEEGSSGSGVVVGNRAILTNCHVVNELGRDHVVIDWDGKKHRVASIRGNAIFDLCLLTVPTLPDRTPAALAPFSGFNVGSRVYSFGNPLGAARTFSAGIVSAVRAQMANPKDALRSGVARYISIQHDAVCEPGSSGGAVLDESGRLIAVMAYKQEGRINYAIPIQFFAYLPKSGVLPGEPFYMQE